MILDKQTSNKNFFIMPKTSEFIYEEFEWNNDEQDSQYISSRSTLSFSKIFNFFFQD